MPRSGVFRSWLTMQAKRSRSRLVSVSSAALRSRATCMSATLSSARRARARPSSSAISIASMTRPAASTSIGWCISTLSRKARLLRMSKRQRRPWTATSTVRVNSGSAS